MFKNFYKKHRKFRTIELNKKVMNEKIEEAQKQSQNGKKMRAEIEDLRRELKQMTEENPDITNESQEVQDITAQIRQKSSQYIEISNALRNLKDEISAIEVIIKQSKKEVKKDFKDLWDSQFNQEQASSGSLALQRSTTSTSATVSKATTPSDAFPTTNDPSVDAKLALLRKQKEEFMKKAANFRASNSSSKPSDTN